MKEIQDKGKGKTLLLQDKEKVLRDLEIWHKSAKVFPALSPTNILKPVEAVHQKDVSS